MAPQPPGKFRYRRTFEQARAWVATLSQPPLNKTVYGRNILPLLRWITSASMKLPWKARLYILWTGHIPEDLPRWTGEELP